MDLNFRNRFALPLVWMAFSLVTIAAAVALHRLYRTAQNEITAQSERALEQTRTEFLDRVQRASDDARHSMVKDLASFHVDGLAQTMQKWDEAKDAVTGTFRWDAARGFSADSIFPGNAPSRDLVAQLWQNFRVWRAQHPKAKRWDGPKPEHLQVECYPMADNPAFPLADLGYQSENLDILAYAHRPVDPWAGWAGQEDDASKPWVFWYQGGPDDEIRGCFFDQGTLAESLRNQHFNTEVARITLASTSAHDAGAHPTAHAYAGEALGLPGYRVYVDEGALFKEKAVSAQLAASVAAGLFAVFFLSAAALGLYTRRQAREAERKVTFTTQVSHELRTPLTSIRMFADLLAAPDLSEPKRLKFAQTVARESSRLETLVERLLSFNTLAKNHQKIARSSVDLTAVVEEGLDEMATSLTAAGLEVQRDFPPEPVVAESDYSIVKQALLNLLDNACKYAREGRRVSIRLRRSGAHVLLQVADEGPGIPRAIRRRLFEPFVQGGVTLTDKSPGVGLGLSLARGTLRKVGGDLKLLDTARGASFQISLPASKSDPVPKV